MLALKTQCVHPDTKKTYIVSSSGGKDNSPEGIAVGQETHLIRQEADNMQGGFTHGFVVEFASASDRDYYIFEDPSHQVFIKKHTPSFDDVRVVDYEKGVF